LERLRARRNAHGVLAVEERHLDLRAEGEVDERHRQLAEEIGAAAGEDRVLADADEHVEIAERPPVHTARALAGETELHAVFDTGGDLDVEEALRTPPALATALAARALGDLAFATTLGTRPRDREKALIEPDLALSTARLADGALRAGLGAGAAARFTGFEARELHFRLEAGSRFLQRDLQLVL